MSLNLVTPAALEPTTPADFAAHARIDPSIAAITTEATWITDCLMAAREWAESFTQRQFITATWELWLDYFPTWEIKIPKAPLISVVSLKYLATDGTLTTLDPSLYLVDNPAGPEAQQGAVLPAYQQTWPVTRRQENAVKIQFTAGYGAAAANVPFAIKRGIYIKAAELYQRREEQVAGTILAASNPPASEALLWPYRSW